MTAHPRASCIHVCRREGGEGSFVYCSMDHVNKAYGFGEHPTLVQAHQPSNIILHNFFITTLCNNMHGDITIFHGV